MVLRAPSPPVLRLAYAWGVREVKRTRTGSPFSLRTSEIAGVHSSSRCGEGPARHEQEAIDVLETKTRTRLEETAC